MIYLGYTSCKKAPAFGFEAVGLDAFIFDVPLRGVGSILRGLSGLWSVGRVQQPASTMTPAPGTLTPVYDQIPKLRRPPSGWTISCSFS